MKKTAQILTTLLAMIVLFGSLGSALAAHSVTVSLTAYVAGAAVPAGEGGNLAAGDEVTIVAEVTGDIAGAAYTWTRTSTGGANAGIPQPVDCTTDTYTFVLERGVTSGNYVCAVTIGGVTYTSEELRISTGSAGSASPQASEGSDPQIPAGSDGVSAVITSSSENPAENDSVTLTATLEGADASGAAFVWSRYEIGGPNQGQTTILDDVTNTVTFTLTPMTSGDYYCTVTVNGTEYVSNTLTVSMFTGGSGGDGSETSGDIPDPSTATPLGINGTVVTSGSRILFTSDIHMTETNLPTLLNTVGSVGLVAFGGDYSSGMTNHLEPDTIHALKDSANAAGAQAIFAAGNHEAAVSNEDWERFAGMPRVGLGAVEAGGAYEVYLFSAAGNVQEFTSEDIAKLSGYLNAAEDSTPIFVVSHFPLHYYNERRNSGSADQVIDLLNQHPNVIFLWGHNHTEGDPKYGTVFVAGDSIQWGAAETDSKTINFTYANMGCLRDGANLNAYGMVADIQGDTVSLCYYDLNGPTSEVITVTMPESYHIPDELITSVSPDSDTIAVSDSLPAASETAPDTGAPALQVADSVEGNLPQTGTTAIPEVTVFLFGISAFLAVCGSCSLRKKEF